MTKTTAIKDALFALDQSALLHDLPDREFEFGGAINDACRLAGYVESGRVVVNQHAAWLMTVAEYAESLEALSALEFPDSAMTTDTARAVLAYLLPDAGEAVDFSALRRDIDKARREFTEEEFTDAEYAESLEALAVLEAADSAVA